MSWVEPEKNSREEKKKNFDIRHRTIKEITLKKCINSTLWMMWKFIVKMLIIIIILLYYNFIVKIYYRKYYYMIQNILKRKFNVYENKNYLIKKLF